MCKSTIDTNKPDYIHLNDRLDDDAAMMVLDQVRRNCKPAARSRQKVAACEEPKRGPKGTFVDKVSYRELQKFSLRVEKEKYLR